MEILENNSEISCVINEKIKRVWERGANRVPSNFDFVFAKIYYIYIYIYSDRFDVLVSKIIF
jgi:hypothetical protein